MRAIHTHYIPGTNKRGARICARSGKIRRVYSWDDFYGPDDNHVQAARRLATELGWRGIYHTGGNDDGSQVHVCESAKPSFQVAK